MMYKVGPPQTYSNTIRMKLTKLKGAPFGNFEVSCCFSDKIVTSCWRSSLISSCETFLGINRNNDFITVSRGSSMLNASSFSDKYCFNSFTLFGSSSSVKFCHSKTSSFALRTISAWSSLNSLRSHRKSPTPTIKINTYILKNGLNSI